MKSSIHPLYQPAVKVTCACGHTFQVGSTAKEIKTELCSACHPFYTGKQKLVDTARRVEKFQAKVAKKATTVVNKKTKRATKAAVRAAK